MMQHATEEVQVVATENPWKDVRILTNLSHYSVVVCSVRLTLCNSADYLEQSPLFPHVGRLETRLLNAKIFIQQIDS